MIKSIKIENFKCFDSISLQLSSLNILTGFNAAGKSTVLQSILLLSQYLRTGNRSPELPLNGVLVQLGTPGEVINSGKGNVIFSISNQDTNIEWSLEPIDRSRGNALGINGIRVNYENNYSVEDLKNLYMLLPNGVSDNAIKLSQDIQQTIFIGAVRIDPSNVYPTPDSRTIVHADVGIRGEYAPWWYHEYLDEDVYENRCIKSDDSQIFRRQLNAWAGELFPGAQVNVQPIEKTNLSRLELRIGDTGDWRRPSNIGYGLTYSFPILVAGLLAKPGQILIVDSPEAHLHPFGQSMMGKFLGQMSESGVQVFIETHSDHVLNGIRLAVQNKIINYKNVSIHFFNNPAKDFSKYAQVVSPEIDQKGNISEWPGGFFDQSENDLARLAGWK